MTALTADRNTPERDGVFYDYPVAAATEIFMGSLVVLDASGNAEPATDAASKVAVGRAEEYVNNTGAAAASNVRVKGGVFRWANSGSNTPTKANIGDTLYIVDDQTVDTLATTSSPAGTMVDIDSIGSWVKTVPPETLVSGLTAANNLSDVGTAATARTNLGLDTMATQAASAVAITGGSITGITDLAVADGGTASSTATAARGALGADQVHLSMRCEDLVAANTEVYRIVSPWAGTIDEIYSILLFNALATGDATLTCSIGGVGITTGVVTITQAGSAEGDIDNVTPSALNVLAAGDAIEVTVGGANTNAAAGAQIIFAISQDV